MIQQISVTCSVNTLCPNTDTSDWNVVKVAWKPGYPRKHVNAEDIRSIILSYAHRKLYCEDLAEQILDEVSGPAGTLLHGLDVTVVVTQQGGHGVEAVATT